MLMSCTEDSAKNVKLDNLVAPYFELIMDGSSGSARVRLRQWMDANGQHPHALFLMGLSYHQEKRYSKAIEWFETAVTSKDRANQYPPTWHFLGWSNFYQGNLQKSKDSFENYLLIHPNECDSIFALGLIALEAGQLDEAEQLFTKSIELAVVEQQFEVQAKATSRLGDLFEERGEFDKAIAQYDEAIALNPDLYESLYRKYKLLNRMKKFIEAKEVLAIFVVTKKRVRPEQYVSSFPE